MSTDASASGESATARARRWLWKRRHPRVLLVDSILFGIAIPLVCFTIGTAFGVFGRATLPFDVYVLIATVATGLWLALRRDFPWLDGPASGVFAGGVLFAACFAVPLGAFAALFVPREMIMGNFGGLASALLALQPFLTLVVYGANTWRAARAARTRGAWIGRAVVGLAASAALPVAAWFTITSSARATEAAILESDAPLERLHLQAWRHIARGYRWPGLVDAYLGTLDVPDDDSTARIRAPRGPKAQRIADAYAALTGGRIVWHD